ncbi:MAG: NADP(H)-dependent aldo-keto reductase [Saprospiraceae bacterium]|nr:NADP(H)-dependent aldo-keto reductase [Saprospiraceae bacterium]
MIYNSLGNTDLRVSQICLGTMTWGRQNTEEDAHQQLDYALTRGINFIDTAEVYAVPTSAETQGLTEQYIGTWIKARKKRDDFFLASKIVGPSSRITWMRENLNFSREQIIEALNNSLARLQTDYLDLYQLHWPERATNFFGKLGYEHDAEEKWTENFLDILESLNEQVNAGKIRYIGLSNETAWAVMKYLHWSDTRGLPRIQSVQNPYNLLNRSYEVGLAEVSIREKVSGLAYSPMAFGLLSGKYHLKQDTPNDRINQFKDLPRYSGDQAWKATQAYLDVARKYGISLAKLSLAFVNSRPFIDSNIIGATTMSQLEENIDSIEVHLSGEMIADINKVYEIYSHPAP